MSTRRQQQPCALMALYSACGGEMIVAIDAM